MFKKTELWTMHIRLLMLVAENGEISDPSFRTLATVDGEGRIRDAALKTLGYVDVNSRVMDDTYRTMGYLHGVNLRKQKSGFVLA